MPKLLAFKTKTCGPCKAMTPNLQRIKDDFEGRLEVEFIDAGDNPALAQQYGIMSVPTCVFLDDSGKELARLGGLRSYPALSELINAIIS